MSVCAQTIAALSGTYRAGTPKQVIESVREILDSVEDTRRILLSCGGGMPPAVSTANIEAFLAGKN